MSAPGPDEDTQADLLEALRARRVAEDTLAALVAAAEPPAIVTALRVRSDRIYREAADLLGRDLVSLDDDDARSAEHIERVIESAQSTVAQLDAARHRVAMLEEELADRASQDERRLQRIAAAEQLRVQLAAVSEALARSEDEYHSSLAAAESAVTGAEAGLERATAALSDAVRRLRRIAEALPPALRPRAGDDPLGELPRLRETLAAEVERAEVALAGATEDLERARREIDETQRELDDHLTVVPSNDVTDDDLRQAVNDLIGTGDTPVVLDDPLVEVDDNTRRELLDALATASDRRPVVLLTDDPDALGWAISLPGDVGAVTRLRAPPDPDRSPDHTPEGAT